MRDLRRCWTNRPTLNCSMIMMLCAAALLGACNGDGESTGPGGGQPDIFDGPQANLGTITTPTTSTTDWLVRALALGTPLSDDPGSTSWQSQAEDDPHNVVPHQFDPFKTGLVRSTWLRGTGCPTRAEIFDFNTSTRVPFADAACPTTDEQDKKFDALLLVKTGPTANFASAAADIKNVKGIVLTELGYDIRRGSHCGGGAPRFNVVVEDGTEDGATHFVGCNSGVIENTSPGWDRRRWGAPLLAALGIPAGAVVRSISIIFDEGQDPPGGPDMSGQAIIDNIDINGDLTGRGPGD